jgi:hypothetical protein
MLRSFEGHFREANMRIHTGAILSAMLLAAACGSTADTRGQRIKPVTLSAAKLSETQYDDVMKAAQVPSDAYKEERNYTAILQRADLTPDQKLRTLYLRAVIRGTTASNLNGALQDYATLLSQLPPEHRLYKSATDNRTYGERQKEYIEQRIAKGPRAQPAKDFLDDLIALGRHTDAVAFVKSSGMAPSDLQVEKFAKLGYMCEGPGYGGPQFRWGYSNTGYHDVHWCDLKGG